MSLPSRIHAYFSSERNSRRYYLAFTLLFFFGAALIYCYLFITGKTLIWSKDGWTQHFQAYAYWGKYLRSLVSSLFSGQFSLPEWDHTLGEGNDILSTLQFYVIGDPFALFSALCPVRYLYILYSFLMILRMYLAGVAFSALCRYVRPEAGRMAHLTGSLCYSFCFWNLVSSTRHPFFLNPLIFFPLIILGIEKLMREKKPALLILSVFFAAVGNFYFFYQIVLLAAIYVIIRTIFFCRKDLKKLFTHLLRIFLCSLLGAVMAAGILLPTLYTYLSDSRLTQAFSLKLLYDPSYYVQLPGMLFGANYTYWVCLCFAAPQILGMIVLFTRKRKNAFLKLLLCLSAFMLLIPLFGQIFNGFSYITNRWSWVISLLVSFILVEVWPDLLSLDRTAARRIAPVLAVLFLVLILSDHSRETSALISFGLTLFLFLILLQTSGGRRKKNALLLIFAAADIWVSSFFLLSPQESTIYGTMKEASEAKEDPLPSGFAIKDAAIADGVTGFYRYAETGTEDSWNTHTWYGLSAPGYYWSLSNPAVSEYLDELDLCNRLPQQHWGTDDRTTVLGTGCVRYLIRGSEATLPVPYGFTEISSPDPENDGADGESLYRNEYPLSLGYFQSAVIDRNQWDTLSPTQKQEALLQGLVLDHAAESGSFTYDSTDPDFKVTCDSDAVTMEDNAFIVTSPNATVTVEMKGVPNSETYFNMTKAEFTGIPAYDLYFGDDTVDPLQLYSPEDYDQLDAKSRYVLRHAKNDWAGVEVATMTLTVSKKASTLIKLRTEVSALYTGIHDYSANLGYSEDAVKTFKIKFSHIGRYDFDSLSVSCLPMDHYAERIAALNAHPMTDEELTTDTVRGRIDAPEDGYLLLSIPCSKGWTAYVDGTETNLLQANIRYMAVPVKAGGHEIRLEYRTPFLRMGLLVSCAGWLLFIGLMITLRLIRRKTNRGDHI